MADPFMFAISPAGAPSCSFPQEVPVSGSIVYHAAFVPLGGFYSLLMIVVVVQKEEK